MSTAIARPDPKRMYGLTHRPDGSAVVRVPRVVRVGIGVPMGPDLFVYTKQVNGALVWFLQSGKEKGRGFKTRAEAEHAWSELRASAEQRRAPQKLPFFTFTRQGPDGQFEPAWDEIEAHGPVPTEIDVLFTDDDPLDASYQWWTRADLQCRGDGLNAERLVQLAQSPAEKKVAAEAQARGSKYFPITECFTAGCKYARADPPQCKPHGTLRFQLVHSPRLGAVAQFDTTSWRSIGNLFGCLETLRAVSRRGVAGIPLKLVLQPFLARHNGKTATAYAVHLEFRHEDAAALRQALLETAARWDEQPKQIAAPVKMIEAPGRMVDEFYPDAEGERPPAGPLDRVNGKTDEKISALREKLAKAKEPEPIVEEPIEDAEFEEEPQPELDAVSADAVAFVEGLEPEPMPAEPEPEDAVEDLTPDQELAEIGKTVQAQRIRFSDLLSGGHYTRGMVEQFGAVLSQLEARMIEIRQQVDQAEWGLVHARLRSVSDDVSKTLDKVLDGGKRRMK